MNRRQFWQATREMPWGRHVYAAAVGVLSVTAFGPWGVLVAIGVVMLAGYADLLHRFRGSR